MHAIDRIEVYGESNAFFDKLKLNHAAASEKVGKVADGKRRLVGDGLEKFLFVVAMCRVDEKDGAVRLILDAQHTTNVERTAADVLIGDHLLHPGAEGRRACDADTHRPLVGTCGPVDEFAKIEQIGCFDVRLRGL